MPDRFLWFYLFFIYLLAIKILTLFDSIFTFFTNFYPGGVIVLVLTFSRFPACVASPNSLTHPIIEKQAKNISFFLAKTILSKLFCNLIQVQFSRISTDTIFCNKTKFLEKNHFVFLFLLWSDVIAACQGFWRRRRQKIKDFLDWICLTVDMWRQWTLTRHC